MGLFDSTNYSSSLANAKPNIINHIQIILDASGSMRDHQRRLIEVVDAQIAHLAASSKEMNQETRISIWTFSDAHDIKCVVWDKDVLRLPSIAGFYRIAGMTAFVDAALKSFDDTGTTSQIYGDHSFLYYFVTDGYENASKHSREDLIRALKLQAEKLNVTVAALVPGAREMMEAKKLGFPSGNVKIWDSNTAEGLEEAAESIKTSTDSFMKFRATGLRSTTDLFDMSSAAVNKQTIKAAGLTPLDPSEYVLVPVNFKKTFREGDDRIDEFTKSLGYEYIARRGFYQLSSASVLVQANKEIAVMEKATNKVYTGNNARALIGLPEKNLTIKADYNADYHIFIQSTSLNRKLLVGTLYLYLTPNVTYTRAPVQPVKPVAAPKVAKMPAAPAENHARLRAPTPAKSAPTGQVLVRDANGRFARKPVIR